MALTVGRVILAPGNIDATRYDIPKGATAGVFFGMNPRKHVSLHVQKNEDAKVYISNTVVDLSGNRITSADDDAFIWRLVSEKKREYFEGNEKGISAMKVVPDSNPSRGIIKVSVDQM